VAPLGTAFTEAQAHLLKRWANKINFLLDNDTAGQNACYKGILTARKAGLECAVVDNTKWEAKDPADILQQFGGGDLTKFVQFGILDYEFLSSLARKRFDTAEAAGLANAVSFLFPLIETAGGEVARSSLVHSISGDFGVDEKSILSDFAVFSRNGGADAHSGGSRDAGMREHGNGIGNGTNRREIKQNGQFFLLEAVFLNFGNTGIAQSLWDNFTLDDFSDPNARELYIALEEARRSDIANFDGALDLVRDTVLQKHLLQKAATGEFFVNPEALVADSVQRLKAEKLNERRKSLIAKIKMLQTAEKKRNSQTEHTEAQIDELLFEKNEIDKQLQGMSA
jgi:DNA primase